VPEQVVELTYLRTWLVLGRVSNLPTVWSNCLAGWLLGGGATKENLLLLLLGATGCYTGGMFLNDAFDAEFDRQYRPERPIPAGSISAAHVWRLGLAWLGLGGLCFIGLGVVTGILGFALIVAILLYDTFHKKMAWAPFLMGFCRFLLYAIAAVTGADRINGRPLWCGIALALYIIGLSFLARGESRSGPLRYWPALMLFVPIFLATIMNADDYREAALLLSAVLALWIARALRLTFWSHQPKVGLTVSSLLAGVVLVDWLAVSNVPRSMSLVFIALFLLALVLQRLVPAT
jgi:4-hydroxybenzoate polyprenyltransferase